MTTRTSILVEEASRGGRSAMEELLARYLPELRAFLRLRTGPRILAKETPDDLAQSVCREVLMDLSQVEYRGETPFKSWLFLTALRKVQDKGRHYAAEKRDAAREWPQIDDPQLCSGYASLMSPSRVAIGREDVQRLEQAFDGLSDEYREVITLSRVLGLSHEEIAERMGRNPGATRVLLHRALARLGRLLRESP